MFCCRLSKTVFNCFVFLFTDYSYYHTWTTAFIFNSPEEYKLHIKKSNQTDEEGVQTTDDAQVHIQQSEALMAGTPNYYDYQMK